MINLPTAFYTLKSITRRLSARNTATLSEACVCISVTSKPYGKGRRKATVEKYDSHTLLDARDISLPPPFRPRFEALASPVEAFLCDENEFSFISANHRVVAQHCNQTHGREFDEERSRALDECQNADVFR